MKAVPYTLPEERWRRAEQLAADAVGALMEFWGFRRHLGRAWTVLYLSPEPLATNELAERLQLSASAISLTLGELVQWGAVRKTHVPGERRDHYVAEARVWKLVTRVLRQRELGLVRDTAELLEEAAALAKAAAGEELPAARARFMAKRIGRLRMLAGAGERLLGAFVSGGILDVGALRSAADERARRGVEGGAAERTSAEMDEQPAPGAGEPEEERGGASPTASSVEPKP